MLALAAAVRSLLPDFNPILDRLRPRSGRAAAVPGLTPSLVAKAKDVDRDDKQREASQIYRLLVHAGFRDPQAVTVFMAVKVALAAGLPLLVFLVWIMFTRVEDFPVWLALVSCCSGFFLPNLWLYSRVSDRKLAINRALPDTLDLLVTCVEAGLGLDAAIARVADEQEFSAPVLASEFKMTFLEIQAGVLRTDAFRRLATRTGVDDLKSLAATLNQTELFGTSVATALRIQSEWIRTRRMQRAEERAATVSVKMTLPLVLFILPSLIMVIMGPGIINIAKNLMPSFG
ncbi:MAG: type II secretion system F family protein [Deltaproteobacteria bacterium]|nr:type II secretion system F family protein [Deltaproteobacteria bacterium]